jgi:hypothetical protein
MNILGPDNPFASYSNLAMYQVGMSLLAFAAGYQIWQATKPGDTSRKSPKRRKRFISDGHFVYMRNLSHLHSDSLNCWMKSF